MPGPMKPSQAAYAALRKYEHIRLEYYDNDGAGNCSFGEGFFVHHGPCTPAEKQRKVTIADVNKTLATRVNEAAAAVRRNVHNPNLTQAQFDALVTYTYNMGPSGAFSVYRAASQGNNTAVADLMSQNIHVKKNGQYKVSLDLQARRVEESAPFRPRQK